MSLVPTLWSALRAQPHAGLELVGEGTLESRYDVSGLAAASIAVSGLATGDAVRVDRALADAWFGLALKPVGWELPSPWDSLAGDYRTADGWIRLHTNAPHHRLAALLVLNVTERAQPRKGAAIVGRELEPEPDFAAESIAERADVTAAVATWSGLDLESEIVESGGAAAVLRTPEEWAVHPQGRAVAAEPLIAWEAGGAARLNGFRVLDLTRVIAGPVATRFLAGLGADVLRIDPPDWNEPAIVPEMTLGKRAARANFFDAGGMRKLRLLIEQADVIVHGYRADAMERLGLDAAGLREINPGIIDVALNAYGWTGPWRNRRGFDSLVQMSSGIAYSADGPSPLPVQALDHATGYLAAAAVLEGLRRRRETGLGSSARLSLARTALELESAGRVAPAPSAGQVARSAYRDQTTGFNTSPAVTTPPTNVDTPWGLATVLPSPLTIGGRPLHWERAPRPLGTDKPRWDEPS